MKHNFFIFILSFLFSMMSSESLMAQKVEKKETKKKMAKEESDHLLQVCGQLPPLPFDYLP